MYNKELNIIPSLKNNYQQFYDPTHPLAYSNGCGYVHRHVASIKEGRWISPNEHVHHLDGNKLNNSIDNVEVISAEEHAKLHLSSNIEDIQQECYYCGKLFIVPKSCLVGKYCSVDCSNKSHIKNPNITKELLDELIPKYSWAVLGDMFGYSDNGIKKRAKALGCIIPKRKKS